MGGVLIFDTKVIKTIFKLFPNLSVLEALSI